MAVLRDTTSPLARIRAALPTLVPSTDQRDLCRAYACCEAAKRQPLHYDCYTQLNRDLKYIGDHAARTSTEYYLAWALVSVLAGQPGTADALLKAMAGLSRRRVGVPS